ncbi:MAG: DedA family protein [Desulfuromonadaceae bacterium]|nr:DedA family protein [Desulfuromonadaceae bacterium]MDD2848246.1 DedA family protein [Desulfuromonadaceae bacterium]MDD4130587.1 DedA family protein [Desulfuromonadaceae bacterium]
MLKEYLELHGYWVLFIGTFLEGEAILLLAGFLAFQGYLNVLGVIGTAWAGSFLGDQFYFYLGHYKGKWVFKRFHSIAKKFREALKLIEKYGNYVAFISRFTYGFRIVLPIILGLTNLAPRTFLWINLVSALIWAVAFSLGGYLFGKSASLVLDNVSNYEQYLVLALFGFISMAWCIHAYHVWKLKKPARQRLARMRAIHASRKAVS